ncbi:MAG TPA: hemerythrin domain-containing protein [Polyangiaceae bacterium]|nr:hemerythrin domain-containing protein [Polyangiaceae bacterium]
MSRSDFYTVVHKHLRRSLFDVSVQLGGLDRTNVVTVVDVFRGIAGMLHGHAQLEDSSVAPLLRQTSADFEAAMTSDHEQLERQLAAVEAQVLRLPSLADDDLELAALDAYRGWNCFVAAYLMHLDDEEKRLFPALGAANPAASGVAGLIVQRGDQGLAFLAMLLPILSHDERFEIMRHLRDAPSLFERGIGVAGASLTPAQLGLLKQALEMS